MAGPRLAQPRSAYHGRCVDRHAGLQQLAHHFNMPIVRGQVQQRPSALRAEAGMEAIQAAGGHVCVYRHPDGRGVSA